MSEKINNETLTLNGFKSNIEQDVQKNQNFRKVIYTSKHLQLVLMTLQIGEDIGLEVHNHLDQFFRIESGFGKCIINENEYLLENGDVIVVPSGAKHNVINTSLTEELKLYTIYTPPNHEDGVVRKTKADAEKSSPAFDGKLGE